MIVREKDGEFILVKQHDHSQLAGRIAAHWRHRPEPYESTLLAIREHDLGWQLLDESVRLNPTTGRPYSFMDLPLEERLPAYTWGIDQVEKIDPYAACLCSRHYVSLLRPYENEHPLVRSFVAKEQKRDARLTADMDETARRPSRRKPRATKDLRSPLPFPLPQRTRRKHLSQVSRRDPIGQGVAPTRLAEPVNPAF